MAIVVDIYIYIYIYTVKYCVSCYVSQYIVKRKIAFLALSNQIIRHKKDFELIEVFWTSATEYSNDSGRT